MSGSTAKTAGRLREAIAQIHDRIHKEEIEDAHALCHQALGSGRVTTKVAPLRSSELSTFDNQFIELCKRLNVSASYVAVFPSGIASKTRIMTGGAVGVDRIVTSALRALEHATTEIQGEALDVEPVRDGGVDPGAVPASDLPMPTNPGPLIPPIEAVGA